MELRILGRLEAIAGGTTVPIRHGRPQAVLAWLALRARDVVPADVLIDRLWGDDLPSNPANALQTQISYLRKTLLSAAPESGPVLVTVGTGYRLDLPDDAIDARRFESMIERARVAAASAPGEALADLDEALALWRDDPVPEIAGHPAAAGEVARLQQLRLGALEARIDLLLDLGQHLHALGDLGQLVRDHPLHERFHGQLMLALYRAGRQAEALRAFEDARKLLAEELGLDVSPELRAIESQILAHAPELAWTDRPRRATSSAAVVADDADRGRPLHARTTSLPAPMTSLVGREAEAARVAELIERGRIVTLTGPGGAGKTRLATEVVRRRTAAGAAAWFVDLTGIDDDDDVAVAVAAALQVATVPGEDVAEMVATSLADERGVLVLDTCEHVVRGAAHVAAVVARNTNEVRVLATSRRPLGTAGELAWPVPPLPLPPGDDVGRDVIASSVAVQLFCERAASVRPDFALTDTNAADVAAICRALDGLPLAIELAAAHADVLTAGGIRTRLADRFRFLVADVVDVAERQRTLRDAIDWSVDLLKDDERAFLARLSIFPSSFEIDAAAAVAEVDDALPMLRSLVRQSLVTVAGDDRFRLLDSIRAYAAELLAEAEEAAAKTRHAAYYAAVADRVDRVIRGPQQEHLVGEVVAELPNFRAALDWSFREGDRAVGALLAASLAWLWTLHGNLSEADRWMRLAVAQEDVPPRLRVRALLGAAIVASPMGDLERTRDLCSEAVALAREAGSRGALGGALINLGNGHWALGELEQAAEAQDDALTLYREHGNGWGVAMAAALRARTAMDAGDLDLAGSLLDDAMATLLDAQDRHLESMTMTLKARLALLRGAEEEAAATAAAALEVTEAVGYTEGIISALHVLGEARRVAGAAGEAAEIHRRALRAAVEASLPAPTIEAVEALARLALESGDDRTAGRLFAAAAAERAARRLPLIGPAAAEHAELVAAVPRASAVPPFRGVIDELLRAP